MAGAHHAWTGLLEGIRSDTPEIELQAVLLAQSEERGGSRPFQGLASDGNIYWIKMLSNRQASRVPITEQVVSRVAALIGAPVCEVALVGISEDFDNDTLENGTILKSGIAHGSKHIERAFFNKHWEPEHRERDDNRLRHAGYFAMYDWCWGDDLQWLYDSANDMRIYSHDHGLFLPGAQNWTVDTLLQSIDEPHPLEVSPENLSEPLKQMADQLDAMTREKLCSVLRTVPLSWPITDEQLEFLGLFLEQRAVPVAGRLREIAKNAG